MQVHLRRRRAGGSSHGYEWPEDGAVVPVDPEHADELLAIPDGGFSVAEVPELDDPEPVADDTDEGPAKPRQPRRRKAATAKE